MLEGWTVLYTMLPHASGFCQGMRMSVHANFLTAATWDVLHVFACVVVLFGVKMET